MSEANNQVKISIFGQEYSVKAPADPDYIKKIAQYLDEKMREVQSGFSSTQSSTRIAILAGMNITDELFTAKQSGEIDSSDAEQKISSLIELIDDAL
jgi:cell division protein ZapA|tara:strand:- start:630 stop:920 length:291 start_codon:yes stop_codon:yes gene_type:complete